MVSITSAAEAAFLAANLQTATEDTWIGLVQTIGSAEPSAGWHWTTGEAFVFSDWTAGAPDDGATSVDGEENNAILLAAGGWNDWNSANTASALIEWSDAENDCDANNVPDSCDPDCDNDGVPNTCEIAAGAADFDLNGIPDSCEYAAGDLNHDGCVNGADLAMLLDAWGSTTSVIADLDHNGSVEAGDLAILLGNWGCAP